MPDAPSTSPETPPEESDPDLATGRPEAGGDDHDGAPEAPRSRLFVRLALMSSSIGLITCIALGILIASNLADEEHFDDADLVTFAPRPIPPEENAGPLIERAVRSLDGREFIDAKGPEGEPLAQTLALSRFGSFAAGGDPEPMGNAESWATHPLQPAVVELLVAHHDFLRTIDTAVERPHCVLPEPASAIEAAEQGFGRYRSAWQLIQLRADAAFAAGDVEATARADRVQLAYAGLITDGSRSIIQKVTAIAQLRAAVMTIARHLDAGALTGHEEALLETIDRVAAALGRHEASEAIRTEYRLFKILVDDAPRQIGKNVEDSPEIGYLFHPNETLRDLGTYYRAAIEEGERTGRVQEAEPPEVRTGTIEKIIHGNGLGHVILELAPLELDSLYVRLDEVIADLAALRVRIAAAAEERTGE